MKCSSFKSFTNHIVVCEAKVRQRFVKIKSLTFVSYTIQSNYWKLCYILNEKLVSYLMQFCMFSCCCNYCKLLMASTE